MKKNLKITGFTLIEVLVSLVITGIMLTLATSSYWIFMKTNMKAIESRNLQQETRFALTRITDRMRAYSINYDEYDVSGIEKCSSGNLNQKVCFHQSFLEYKENPDKDESTDDAMLYLDEQPLFSPNKFKVSEFFVDFSPKKNPYGVSHIGNIEVQIQPKLTIFINLESKKFENMNLPLQTTISSRKYNE